MTEEKITFACPSCGADIPKYSEICPKCEVEIKKKQVIKQVSRVLTKDYIAEEVYNPPKFPQFVVYYFDRDEFEYVDQISLGEIDRYGRKIVYEPVFNDHVKEGMVTLPRKPVQCKIEDVIREAQAFVLRGFDPCDRVEELKIIVLIVISSWFLDKERPFMQIAGMGMFAAIIPLRGPSGTGKNRLANEFRFISYHPFFDVSTRRIPSLYRPLHIWRGTLVMDEADHRNTGVNSELIHFLNARATGTPIGRQNPDSPAKCDAFHSFGQTIVTQRRHFEDNATEGRSIPYYCDQGGQEIPTLMTKEMMVKGLELQDKLLYIRMKYWNKIVIDKTVWIDGVSDHRLNSTLLPVLALAKFAPELEEIINNSIRPLEKARRRLKAQSDDGRMINVLWEKIESELWGVHNGQYYVGKEKDVYQGIDGEEAEQVIPLTTSVLQEQINKSSKEIRKIIISLNIAPKEHPSMFRIGKRRYRGIMFDLVKLEKRLREFVMDYEQLKLYKVLGVTHVTDVTRNMRDGLNKFMRENGEKKSPTETSVTDLISENEKSSRNIPVTCVTSVTTQEGSSEKEGRIASNDVNLDRDQCGLCEYFHDEECDRPAPLTIMATAELCPKYKRRQSFTIHTLYTTAKRYFRNKKFKKADFTQHGLSLGYPEDIVELLWERLLGREIIALDEEGYYRWI